MAAKEEALRLRRMCRVGCGSSSACLPGRWFLFWHGYKGGVGRESPAGARYRGAARMGAQSLAAACGALALCLALTGATNPGFVVRITQSGLDYGGFGFLSPSLQMCWWLRRGAGRPFGEHSVLGQDGGDLWPRVPNAPSPGASC